MNTIPILMYHSIAKPIAGTTMKSLNVTPRNFLWQMKLLKYFGYQGLSMRALTPYLKGECHGKVVGITFDDGYENNLLNAMPILQQCGFSATCYLVSDLLGSWNQWDENKGIARNPLMSIEQVRNWLDGGMDIGSHTSTHAHLTQLNSEQAQSEIYQCKQTLEHLFQTAIDDFCYPYGEYNDDVRDVVQKSNYHTATTIEKAHATVGEENLLLLPRIFIAYRTLPHLFLMKVVGWF